MQVGTYVRVCRGVFRSRLNNIPMTYRQRILDKNSKEQEKDKSGVCSFQFIGRLFFVDSLLNCFVHRVNCNSTLTRVHIHTFPCIPPIPFSFNQLTQTQRQILMTGILSRMTILRQYSLRQFTIKTTMLPVNLAFRSSSTRALHVPIVYRYSNIRWRGGHERDRTENSYTIWRSRTLRSSSR